MRTKSDIVFRALGDGGVLIDLETNQIYELNETGAAIWSLLDQGSSPESIVEALVTQFDAAETVVRAEMIELLAALESHGLIVQ